MDWLVANWNTLLPKPWSQVALAAAAVVCGAIVGTEREKREKPAGLRTLVLVCLGSAVFTMVSFAFGTSTGDTGRVSAQIVTGIGFLGAGVIIHGRTAVSGITTAATIWATAATGMAVGVGYAGAGLALSVGMRLILTGMYWWERYIGGARWTVLELLFDDNHGKTRIHLERLAEEFEVRHGFGTATQQPDGATRLLLRFRLGHRHRVEFMEELANLDQIREIREVLEGADP
jgi:putative Mg2+ transporter-C (MgtC) family protein